MCIAFPAATRKPRKSVLISVSNRMFTRSNKRPANVQHWHMYVEYIILLEICWMFAKSCKHPIRFPFSIIKLRE